jgi:hypothetical protein
VQAANRDVGLFQALAKADSTLNWYAVADSAQHDALPRAVAHGAPKLRCLLEVPEGSPVSQKSPHLVQLISPLEPSNTWSWIYLNARLKPCISIIAARNSFEDVFTQLSSCTEVSLPDGDEMILAFWDPAILGTLLGQSDDRTLHIKGPVLKQDQRTKLIGNLNAWWYWDRTGSIHSIVLEEVPCRLFDRSITLSQQQVDDLVEASVPDHVLHYINSNQPHLLDGVASEKRYEFVSHALSRGRAIGITGMRDLVNYICVELIYKEKMNDIAVTQIFDDVKAGRMEFDAALDQLP